MPNYTEIIDAKSANKKTAIAISLKYDGIFEAIRYSAMNGDYSCIWSLDNIDPRLDELLHKLGYSFECILNSDNRVTYHISWENIHA